MMNGQGKSDRPAVPEKSPNNAGQPVAEGMEGRGLAKGNLPQQNASRTPSRTDAPSALERVRQAAKKDKKLRFTALLHHIYNLETLRRAYLRLKREAAPGVDGETWRHYGEATGRESPGPLRKAEARSVPGEAGAEGVHPQGRRAAEAARSDGAGRQDRPARGGRGVERHLRNGLSRFLVRVPARAQPASRAGCALHGIADEKGELGARSGHQGIFRWNFPRLAGEVRRASNRGPARRAAHPEMAERRRAGGRETLASGGRDAPGRQCLAAAGEHLSPLCLRPVGPNVASEAGARRRDRRALCR